MQETEEKTTPQFDEKRCRETVNYDLKMAIAFLQMIYRDPELLATLEQKIVDKTKAHYENKALNPELDFDGKR